MKTEQFPASLSRELTSPGDLAAGSKGAGVRRIQEWLGHHGYSTAIDGAFGPATEMALKLFQGKNSIPVNGHLDKSTWAALTAPLTAAISDVNLGASASYDTACLAIARQHLKQNPRELGGDNCGPWVRTYMNGNDGPDWYWCAGFVSFVMLQVALQTGISRPIAGSVSCDTLASQAKTAGRFLSATQAASNPASLGRCFIFLVRRTNSDWIHTGLGFNAAGETFSTIEGNTNDDGSRDGYEVCARSRALAGKDFIPLG